MIKTTCWRIKLGRTVQINEEKWLPQPATFSRRLPVVVPPNSALATLKNEDGSWNVKAIENWFLKLFSLDLLWRNLYGDFVESRELMACARVSRSGVSVDLTTVSLSGTHFCCLIQHVLAYGGLVHCVSCFSKYPNVETILDKDNFTLEELLDEDEIIQECKALNGRLINFLRERTQVEQLIRYIVEEAPEDADRSRSVKFPFIACEIFTCEVDIILKTLVEDEELMGLLFSFLEPKHTHSPFLAGYFSKVVICLLLRKTAPFLSYIQAHREIMQKLVDLIGITSIMEVLIRLIGLMNICINYTDAVQWIQDTNVLEMIVDKFSSSDSPEVHANAAETLCAITRFAPAGLSAKISSPSFVGRLFRHALEESRPKSVLNNSLTICITLLDPKRLNMGAYHMFGRQMTLGSTVTANPETVEGMLESLGDLLKLLDVSSSDNILLTTYGKLQPPLGKHRLKIVEFISVLLAVGSEAAEKELIRLGALQRISDLFFEYPYNNFLHHHVENIINSCLESKNAPLVEHILRDCNLVGKILEAEKNTTLTADSNKPTVPAEGRSLPRIGNIGHITRLSNKINQLGNTNSDVQALLQANSEWSDHTNVLAKRNALENVYQWACGYVLLLKIVSSTNNLSQAFRYGMYSNDMDEGHGSLERGDDEDVYFDDESAEVVISSLRLGDDQDSGSLFTNSNWFAFEEDNSDPNERSTGPLASPSPNAEGTSALSGGEDVVNVGKDITVEVETVSEHDKANEDDELIDTATPSVEPEAKSEDNETWDSGDPSSILPNGELPLESPDAAKPLESSDAAEPSPSSPDKVVDKEAASGPPAASEDKNPPSKSDDEIAVSDPATTGIAETAVDKDASFHSHY
uniref:SIT4 phosphatase-associated family protein n=1 Tax=Cannabis sativa TaxID=3483 RepID=A0A803Q2V7_CANSA